MELLTNIKQDLLSKALDKKVLIILTLTRQWLGLHQFGCLLSYGLEIHQIDVRTFFLNGELEEDIYIEQPAGFVVPGKEKKMCKLIKSLYELNKQQSNGMQILIKPCCQMDLRSMNVINVFTLKMLQIRKLLCAYM